MFLDITEDLLFAPVTELAPLLRDRKITSAALTDVYLDRLDKFGTKLGAVVTITKDLARKEAAQAEGILGAAGLLAYGKDAGQSVELVG